MKKIIFGIAIMLFGIILEKTFNLEYFACALGTIGIIFAIVGLVSKEDK